MDFYFPFFAVGLFFKRKMESNLKIKKSTHLHKRWKKFSVMFFIRVFYNFLMHFCIKFQYGIKNCFQFIILHKSYTNKRYELEEVPMCPRNICLRETKANIYELYISCLHQKLYHFPIERSERQPWM